MPATISQQSIPNPTADNLLPVCIALRNALIALSNTAAGRASPAGTVTSNSSATQPSQFNITAQVWVSVTYNVGIVGGTGTASVTIPQLKSITFTNPTTNEVLSYTVPGKAFTGGTVGAAL